MKQKDNFLLGFWSFNGSMKKEEIIRQIRDMHEQGFDGFFMHARAGIEIPYCGEEWFAACETAILEAEKLGMTAWIYDEDGWPSGFAGGKIPELGEDYQAKHLCFTNKFPKRNVLAAYRKTAEGKFTHIDVKDSREGDYYIYYETVPHYVDLLNPEVTREFIKVTHEIYKQRFSNWFGNVIKGVFTDEPQLIGRFPYTFAFPEQYKNRFGADFLDNAWQLFIDGEGAKRFRYTYWKLVSSLFEQSFTKQIADWCSENGILMTGHFSNEDGLCNQVKSNGDLLSHYTHMQAPGIDHLGNRLASPVLLKQVGDAAYIHNKPMVLSESFGCAGWDASFSDLAWITHWQSCFGVNVFVAHLSAYSIKGRRKRDYPAFYSYQEPWWDRFNVFASYNAGLQEWLKQGRSQADIMVLHPVTGVWCELGGPSRFSGRLKYLSSQFRQLIENLIDLQMEFHIVSEQLLCSMEIMDGVAQYGVQKYTTLIVPETTSLDEETAQWLIKFAQSNGRVIFINSRPGCISGIPDERLETIAGIDIANRKALLNKYFLYAGMNYEDEVLDIWNGAKASGLVLARKKEGDKRYLFLFNPSRSKKTGIYIKSQGVKTLYRYDPSEKTREPISSSYGCGFTSTPINLEATEAVLLEVAEGRTEQSARTALYTQYLNEFDVKLCDPNALTVDCCDISLNHRPWKERVFLVKELDNIQKAAVESQGDTKVLLTYRFDADFLDIPSDIALVAEGEGFYDIRFNGHQLKGSENDWWIDRAFYKYPVSQYIKNGENIVEMRYIIKKPEQYLDVEKLFETVRNRHFYPIEPESVYICGSFDVVARGEKSYSPDHITIHPSQIEKPFFITDAAKKKPAELTSQGLWFYRGQAEFTTEFEAPDCSYAELNIQNGFFTLAEVFINGEFAGTLFKAPFRLSLKNKIKKGKNRINFRIYGHNRNLLGPHHHILGNPRFVGPSTFAGKKGFEDFISPQVVNDITWTDAYSFVPFGLGKAEITYFIE